MNKPIKRIILTSLLILGLSLPAFAQSALSDLQKGVADFSGALAESLPFNASLGLNWSDAYIGKILPSVPPHFGVGGSFGVTTMNLPVIKELAGTLGYNLPLDMGRMILPAYTAEARIGGFFLPFDIGVKAGYLPPVTLWGSGMDVDYLLMGADIRYAVLDMPVLPLVSVGVGVNYLKGGVGGSVGTAQEISYNTHTISLNKPDVNLQWETFSIDFKAQVSKSFLIITPYLGVGGSYAWSSAGYSVDSTVNYDGDTIVQADIDNIKAFLKSQGLDDIDIDEAGISSIIKNKAFSFRAFGGLSVNLALFRIDLTGLYSFRDSNFGASLGLRFQL